MGWPLPRPVSNCSSKLCNVLSACWANCRYRFTPSQFVGTGGCGVGPWCWSRGRGGGAKRYPIPKCVGERRFPTPPRDRHQAPTPLSTSPCPYAPEKGGGEINNLEQPMQRKKATNQRMGCRVDAFFLEENAIIADRG